MKLERGWWAEIKGWQRSFNSYSGGWGYRKEGEKRGVWKRRGQNWVERYQWWIRKTSTEKQGEERGAEAWKVYSPVTTNIHTNMRSCDYDIYKYNADSSILRCTFFLVKLLNTLSSSGFLNYVIEMSPVQFLARNLYWMSDLSLIPWYLFAICYDGHLWWQKCQKKSNKENL